MARPDDGHFDLVLIEAMGRLQILRHSPQLYSGRIAENPKVHVFQGRQFRVEPLTPGEVVPLEYDGEAEGVLPATFTLCERVLPLRM